MDESKLLKLKKQIDESKIKLAELDGRKKTLTETLKKTWKCSTVKEAEMKLESIKKEIEALEEKKQRKIKKLEEDYEF